MAGFSSTAFSTDSFSVDAFDFGLTTGFFFLDVDVIIFDTVINAEMAFQSIVSQSIIGDQIANSSALTSFQNSSINSNTNSGKIL